MVSEILHLCVLEVSRITNSFVLSILAADVAFVSLLVFSIVFFGLPSAGGVYLLYRCCNSVVGYTKNSVLGRIFENVLKCFLKK